MVTIAIVAALMIAAVFFFVSVLPWAQQTFNNYQLTNLNMALTDYQTLGGMTQAHSLQGLNNSTEVAAVLNALKTGFTVGGQKRAFLQPNSNIDPTQLYAAGQGALFHFCGYGTGTGLYGTQGIEGQILATLQTGGITPVAGLATWIETAQAAAGNTANYLLLTQPSSSTVIGFYVKGTRSLQVNWGDGATQAYTLSGSSQAITHTFASAGTYGVTLIGNVTYFDSQGEAPIGGAVATSFGGNIATMTGLTYLSVGGTNTLSGSITNLTGLTYLYASGSSTLSGNITNLTGLSYLSYWPTGGGFSGSVTNLTQLTRLIDAGLSGSLSGDITSLTGLTYLYVTSSNAALAGSVTNLTGLTCLFVFGPNTVTGSVTNLTNLSRLVVQGSNTLSGSLANMTSMTQLNISGSNTVTAWETVAANAPGLYQMVHGGNSVLSSAQVNAILAGFWANVGVSKSVTGSLYNREIQVNKSGDGPPTGAGITNKANLQGTITPPGSTYWTVLTN